VTAGTIRATLTVVLLSGALVGTVAPDAGADTLEATCDDIQQRLDQANDGDVVQIVGDPTCMLGVGLTLNDKAITLRGPATLDGTNISGTRILSTVDIGDSVLEQLTFQNGFADGGHGGGFYAVGDSTPTFRDVTFFDNRASGSGGGAYIESSGTVVSVDSPPKGTVLVDNVTAIGNTAGDDGGAIAVHAFFGGAEVVSITGGSYSLNRAGDSPPAPTGSGGAVSVRADGPGRSVTVASATFEKNHARRTGGGVDVASYLRADDEPNQIEVMDSTFDRNTAGLGGGGLSTFTSAPIPSSDEGANFLDPPTLSVLRNHFARNRARSGGGARLDSNNRNDSVLVSANTFRQNIAECTSEGSLLDCLGVQGGGLGIFVDATDDDVVYPIPVRIEGNLLDRNEVRAGPQTTSPGDGREFFGGGTAVTNGVVRVRGDRYVGNVIPAAVPGPDAADPSDDLDAVGSALAIVEADVHADGVVMTGNRGGAGAEGTVSVTEGALQLVNSTVVANSVGAGGSAGLSGDVGSDVDETLTLFNSIVGGNESDVPDITEFDDQDVRFSDVCTLPGFSGDPVAGEGNICADPDLTEVAEGFAHQTETSVTVDAGSNQLVAPAGPFLAAAGAKRLDVDVDDEARIQDGDGDGTATVDMGADELPGADVPDDLFRLFGAGRTQTAIEISQDSFADDTAGVVVLAREDLYPDALAGTPLAVTNGGPILLTATTTLHDIVADELQRLLGDDGKVYLLGGEAALSAAVDVAVQALGYQTERLAGPSRIETALAIAGELGDPGTVLITTGFNFPDALGAGAAAAHIGGAVLLTTSEVPHSGVDTYLAAHPSDRFAIGGPAARAYPAATPVFGPSRNETAVATAEQFFDAPTVVGFARDDDFPDALTGGAHIGAKGGPMLLTPTGSLHPAPEGYLCDNAASIHTAYVYGGTAAIAQTTVDTILARIAGALC